MSTADLMIETWHNEISVSRHHPDPLRVRDHIDKLTRHASLALERALETYLRRKGREVILVRSLDFAMDLDTGCDFEQATRVLAKRMTHQLVEQIESNAPTVVRFASEATYRARFIEDLANGRAWGQWYYNSFEGLQALQTSCAIRSVLVDDPNMGRATLAALPAEAWSAIGSALDDADAVRIVNGLVDESTELDGAALLDEVTQLAVRLAHSTAYSAPKLALTLIATLHRGGLSCTPTLIRATEVVAVLLTARRTHDQSRIRALLDGTEARNASSLFHCVPTHLRVATAPLMSELAGHILAEIAAGTPTELVQANEPLASYDTPFAGLVVLLDEVDRYLSDQSSNKGILALTILACVAGRKRREALWHDSAWRSIFQVDPSLTWSEFVQFADCPQSWRRFFLRAARVACRRLARRIPGMQDASFAYLRANFLLAHGRCDLLEPNRYRMCVASPPLHVLLSLTGISRGSRTWHDADETRIDLEYL